MLWWVSTYWLILYCTVSQTLVSAVLATSQYSVRPESLPHYTQISQHSAATATFQKWTTTEKSDQASKWDSSVRMKKIMVKIKFEGKNLANCDFWTKSDPYLQISRPPRAGSGFKKVKTFRNFLFGFENILTWYRNRKLVQVIFINWDYLRQKLV